MNDYEKSIINLDLNNQNLNVILGCTNEIVQNVLTHSIKSIIFPKFIFQILAIILIKCGKKRTLNL